MTVRLDPHVLREILGGLRGVDRTSRDIVLSVRSATGGVRSRIAFEVARRTETLHRAEDALASCREAGTGACAAEAQMAQQARRRLDAAIEARRIVQDAVSRFEATSGAERRAIEALVTAGDGRLRRKLDELAGISAKSGPAPAVSPRAEASMAVHSGMASASATPAVYVPPGFAPGFAMVPVALIDQSFNPITGPSDFTKGYSVEDLEAAFELLESEVVPALARGDSPAGFASADARHGRSGVRSAASTYRGFLGDGGEAIRVSRTTQGFSIDNGRHRVWVAARTGRTHVPARIVGGQP